MTLICLILALTKIYFYHPPSHTRAHIEQVEAYAQMLSDTCPAKVHQLINEHENYINKLSKDWDKHISQASQNLLATCNARNVPNYAVSKAVLEAGVPLTLIYTPFMKKFVVNKMASLAANGRQPIYKSPSRKRNRNAVDDLQPINRVSKALKFINRTSVSAIQKYQIKWNHLMYFTTKHLYVYVATVI